MSGVARVRYKNPGGAALTRATGQPPNARTVARKRRLRRIREFSSGAANDPHAGPLSKRERGKVCSIGPLSLEGEG